MQLQHGQAALQALQSLDARHIPAVVFEPRAAGGMAELMAVGNVHEALVVDVPRTPELAAWLAKQPVAAAWDAKATYRACLTRFGTGPARWACAGLSGQLLAGGRDAARGRSATAAAWQVSLPDARDSVAALAEEARAVARVLARQGQALQQADMQRVSRIESRAVNAVAEMEHGGMPFDAAMWQSVTHDIRTRYQQARRDVLGHLQASPQTDISHDAALLQLLRQAGIGVQNAKRSTLGALPAPLGPWLEAFKTLEKQLRAYGTAYLDHVGEDGRLHATFEQIGASTGRMACHSPNLQAMVKGTAHRSCFRPAPQRRLVVADYAACELRILAQISRDPVFMEAFAKNEDVHARVAGSIFGEPVSKTHKPHLRHIAKTVSFGLVYGMGAAGLARTLRCDGAAARDLMERFFAIFPRIRGALQALSATAQERGWAQTRSGRRLYLDGPAYREDAALLQRVAKNMPIQGTNADIIKLALSELRNTLKTFQDARIVHCIHDEIVVECAQEIASEVCDTVGRVMVAAGRPLLADVPLAVESRILPHWGAE